MHQVTVGNQHRFSVQKTKDGIVVNEQPVTLDVSREGQRMHVLHNGRAFHVEQVAYDRATKTATYKINGKVVEVKLRSKTDLLLESLGMNQGAKAGANNLKAPMPGLVLTVHVTAGQEVKKGEPLLVLEAMKMENVLKAPADGTVKRVAITPGQKVEKNAVLIEF